MIEYLLSWCSVLHSLLIKYTTRISEFYLDLLTSPQGSSVRVCVRIEYVLAWCSMFYSLILIYSMKTFSKTNVLTFDSFPLEGVCKEIICACMLLHSSFPNIQHDHVLKKIILTF